MARRFIPFALHQAAELLLAVLLIVVGIHVSGPSQIFLVAGGVLLVVLAVLSDGPLAAWELLSRRAHRVADWIGIAVLALLPALPGRTLLSAFLLEFSALAVWRLNASTRFEPRPARVRPAGPAGAVGPVGPVGPARTGGAAPSPGLAPAADLALRRTARKAGIAAGIIRRRRMRS
ncbi:MAG: hypothetical protein ACYCS2_10605 [Acidimicrobiales bacterium]